MDLGGLGLHVGRRRTGREWYGTPDVVFVEMIDVLLPFEHKYTIFIDLSKDIFPHNTSRQIGTNMNSKEAKSSFSLNRI
jgi:hypothetical protein